MAVLPAHLQARGLLPALLPLISGCAASISTHVSEPVRPAQPSEVTVLAVMPGTVEPGSEWLRRETVQQLVLALTELHPSIEIIGPEETAQRLSAQSLATDYAALLRDFEGAGVVDPARVDDVLNAVGATHFLHIRAGYAGEGVERATTNLDGSPLFYSTKHQSLYAVASLWESSGSAPSWEVVARSESEGGPFFIRDREPVDLIESIVRSVAKSIPLGAPDNASSPVR